MRKMTFMLLLLPICSIGQKNYTALFDAYMQAQVEVNDFNGSVLVGQKGNIIYEKGFGFADREWKNANTAATKFEWGSITKQFTAACILQLAEQGKLDLDDHINKYIPGYPKGDSVTIHMLLNHTSGIFNYTSVPEFRDVARLSLSKDSMISFFKNRPYDFSPGTSWNYSNSGYFLLGYIIEAVSGQTYRDYLFSHVIQKAGLQNTDANRWDSVLAFRAHGYSKTNYGYRNADFISLEWPYSAGVLYSTVEDMFQWNQSLYHGKILSARMLEKMTTPYRQHYGYGLQIDTSFSHRRISHGGGIPGFITANNYYPNDDVTIIVLSNNESNSGEIADALAATIFGLPVTLPNKPKEVHVDPALLDKYIGKYSFQNFTFEIYKKDNKLFVHLPHGDDAELKPESATRFFVSSDNSQVIEFELSGNAQIKKVYLEHGGDKMEAKKL